MPQIKLPLLRVHGRPDGSVTRHHREAPQQPIDDGWWRDVLLDPRARRPVTETRFDENSPFAHLRLDRQHGDEFLVTCGCGRGGVFNKASLIRQMGGDANVLWIAHHMIDCGSRNKVSNSCRAYCANKPIIRRP